MPRFRYRTRDHTGLTVEAMIEAAMLHEVSAKLRSAEIEVISIESRATLQPQ